MFPLSFRSRLGSRFACQTSSQECSLIFRFNQADHLPVTLTRVSHNSTEYHLYSHKLSLHHIRHCNGSLRNHEALSCQLIAEVLAQQDRPIDRADCHQWPRRWHLHRLSMSRISQARLLPPSDSNRQHHSHCQVGHQTMSVMLHAPAPSILRTDLSEQIAVQGLYGAKSTCCLGRTDNRRSDESDTSNNSFNSSAIALLC